MNGETFWGRLVRYRSGRVGLVLVGIILLGAVAGPMLSPYDPETQDLELLESPPSLAHPAGTDLLGRDLFTRLFYGARVSVGVGLMAALIAAGVGIFVGLAAGLAGGAVDWILMRTVDVLLAFPRLVVVLLAVGFSTPSLGLTVVVLGLLSWMEVARIVRGEVLVVREALYVKSAIALGLSRGEIATRYVLPNVISPVIVSTALLVGTVILVEATLSFLGLGVQPPHASWGTILNQGRIDPVGSWWISTFAGLLIVMTVVGVNLLADGLREATDPRRSR
ncbi:MAG: ABC transporter permease [Fidelibacterota bacterium]